jgi:hypothetical protein
MGTILFEGDKKQGGIPRKASVRVESLPSRSVVFSGTVSKSIALDLDPGKYTYSVTKLIQPPGLQGGRGQMINYIGEFFHEVEPAAWEKLKHMGPQMCRPIQTSDGPRWRCTFPRCREEEFTSAMSALLHEVGHFGVSQDRFLKDPDLSVLYDGQGRVEEYMQETKAAAKAQGIAPLDPLRLGSPVASSKE